jgi:hypothetical protein
VADRLALVFAAVVLLSHSTDSRKILVAKPRWLLRLSSASARRYAHDMPASAPSVQNRPLRVTSRRNLSLGLARYFSSKIPVSWAAARMAATPRSRYASNSVSSKNCSPVMRSG